MLGLLFAGKVSFNGLPELVVRVVHVLFRKLRLVSLPVVLSHPVVMIIFITGQKYSKIRNIINYHQILSKVVRY